MIRLEEAWDALLPHLQPLDSRRRSLAACRGRVLSRDLEATLDVPPCDVSAMDGFALPASETTGDRRLGSTIAAGDPPGHRLAEENGAIPRIMTGAPVPPDCDRVVPVEDAVVEGDVVRFSDTGSPGQHIRRLGEVSRRGATLVPAGAEILGATASLLATHGHDPVPVHRTPTVAFATTGSEIVPPETTPGPGQIRDSHSAFFTAALSALDIEGEALGIVPDDPESLRSTVRRGLERDVLILSGGVSKGEFDLVEGVLAEFGCTALFDAVAIQPGKPVVAAHHPGGLVFGLPGNPASAQVTFRLFVRPALRRLMGHRDTPWGDGLSATLVDGLPGARGRERFLPCRVRHDAGRLLARPLPPRGSHDVAAYGLVNALVRIPAGQPPRSAGEACSIVFVD